MPTFNGDTVILTLAEYQELITKIHKRESKSETEKLKRELDTTEKKLKISRMLRHMGAR